MNVMSFSTRVPGKWVLAGEHSVLRGGEAIAFPHPEFFLELEFESKRQRDQEGLVVLPEEARAIVLQALQKRGDAPCEGILRLNNTIPIGAGFGSSAALCVGLIQWLASLRTIPHTDWFELARDLEDSFHGKSSGMDVAVVLAGQPILFSMKKGAQPLGLKRLPRFTFHDTEIKMRTSESVQRVSVFCQAQKSIAEQTDTNMGSAVQSIREGLLYYSQEDTERGLSIIASGMKQAQQCFYTWGLVPQEAQTLEDELYAQGALAVKLTGAGGGGMLVALWRDR